MTSDRPSDGLRVPNIDKVRSWRVPALQPISRVIHPRPNASHCEVPTHTLTLFHDSSTSRFVVFGCLLQNQSLRNLYSPHLQNNILTTGYVLVLIGTKCFKEKWQKVKPKKNTAPQMQWHNVSHGCCQAKMASRFPVRLQNPPSNPSCCWYYDMDVSTSAVWTWVVGYTLRPSCQSRNLLGTHRTGCTW